MEVTIAATTPADAVIPSDPDAEQSEGEGESRDLAAVVVVSAGLPNNYGEIPHDPTLSEHSE